MDRSRNHSRVNSRSSHGYESEQGSRLSINRIKAEIENPKPNPEETWISLDALILLGCLHCGGYDSEKAEVFHRIIAPEYESIVKITDKDLKSAMYFMITAATIVEGMIRDLVESPRLKVDYSHYEKLVAKYRPTFQGMQEDFEDTVFGTHYNRRNKDTFIELMAVQGWKYFQVNNLNELFTIMLELHGCDDLSSSDDSCDLHIEVDRFLPLSPVHETKERLFTT